MTSSMCWSAHRVHLRLKEPLRPESLSRHLTPERRARPKRGDRWHDEEMIQHDDCPFDLLPSRGQESGPDDDGDHDRGEDNQCEHRTGGAASSRRGTGRARCAAASGPAAMRRSDHERDCRGKPGKRSAQMSSFDTPDNGDGALEAILGPRTGGTSVPHRNSLVWPARITLPPVPNLSG